jgi:hypothetical protein
VLAVGESVPESLEPFVGASADEASRLRSYFQNLGDHLQELFDVSLQRRNVQELLHAKTDECAHAQALHQATAVACGEAQALQHESAIACSRAQAECAQAVAECAWMAQELHAARRHYTQLRYRVVDKVSNRMVRVPVVYRLLRSMAHGAAAVRREYRSRAR